MRIAILCTSMLTSCALLAATPINGWYSSVFGGYAYVPGNVDKTRNGLNRNDVKYQSGFDGGGNFGFKSNPMRYEGDVTYIKANVNSFKVNKVNQTGVSGYNQAIFGLANVYYDFPGFTTLIQPYLGLGIGYGWIQTKIDSTGPLPLGLTTFTADNSAFAYQGSAGLTYNFAENYALNLGYRYMTTLNLSQFGQFFQAHMANLGATYRFDGNNYK